MSLQKSTFASNPPHSCATHNVAHNQACKQPPNLIASIEINARFGDFSLKDIELEIMRNDRIGIIGESGSGKSLLAKLTLGLVRADEISGSIRLFTPTSQGYLKNPMAVKSTQSFITHHTIPLTIPLATTPLDSPLYRSIRATTIAYIPQSPLLALNPLHSVYKQLAEMFLLHAPHTPKSSIESAIDSALVSVGLEPSIKHRLPHTLSGGQAQRVCIAMMSLMRPQILICDEPTTALDAHIQKQILQLLDSLTDVAIVFISHDLKLITSFAKKIIVMQGGRICDRALCENGTLSTPQTALHPYTLKLLNALHLPKAFPAPIIDYAPTSTAFAIPSLSTHDFCVHYRKTALFSKRITALSGVSFSLYQQDSIGIIGASGSGKSSLALGILGLEEHSGELMLDINPSPESNEIESRALPPALDSILPLDITKSPQMLATAHHHTLKHYASKKRDKTFVTMVQIVFQDPLLALNPRHYVQEILQEAHALTHTTKASTEYIARILARVGLGESFLYRYTQDLSGGEAQRVCIARAVISGAKILILDEPTSALDKSTQKDIITLLEQLQQSMGLSYIVISHDLDVIEAMCRRVLVLDSGRVIEQGEIEAVFTTPKHDYTKLLLQSRI